MWDVRGKQDCGPPGSKQPQLVEELRGVARRERDGLHEQFAGFASAGLQHEVWKKTMEEVETRILEGPKPIEQIDDDCTIRDTM